MLLRKVSSVKVRLSLQRAKDSFDNVYVGVKPGQMLLDLMMRMDSAHIKVCATAAAAAAVGCFCVGGGWSTCNHCYRPNNPYSATLCAHASWLLLPVPTGVVSLLCHIAVSLPSPDRFVNISHLVV